MNFQWNLQKSCWTQTNCSFHDSAMHRLPSFCPVNASRILQSLGQLKKNLPCKPSKCLQGGGQCSTHWWCSFPFLGQAMFFEVVSLLLQPIAFRLPFLYSPCCLRYIQLSNYLLCEAVPNPCTCHHSHRPCSHSSLCETHITAFITLWYHWFLCTSPPLEWELPGGSTEFSTHGSQHHVQQIIDVPEMVLSESMILLFRLMGK